MRGRSVVIDLHRVYHLERELFQLRRSMADQWAAGLSIPGAVGGVDGGNGGRSMGGPGRQSLPTVEPWALSAPLESVVRILQSVGADVTLSQRQAAAVARALDLLTATTLDAPDLQRQIDIGRLNVDRDTQVREPGDGPDGGGSVKRERTVILTACGRARIRRARDMAFGLAARGSTTELASGRCPPRQSPERAERCAVRGDRRPTGRRFVAAAPLGDRRGCGCPRDAHHVGVREWSESRWLGAADCLGCCSHSAKTCVFYRCCPCRLGGADGVGVGVGVGVGGALACSVLEEHLATVMDWNFDTFRLNEVRVPQRGWREPVASK